MVDPGSALASLVRDDADGFNFQNGRLTNTYPGSYTSINNQRVIDSDAQSSQCEGSRCAVPNARRSDAAGHLRAAVPRRRTDGRVTNGPGRGLATGGLKAPGGPEAGRAGARPPPRPPDAL